MKTIITIIFFTILSFTAQAQNNTADVNVETMEMSIVTQTINEIKTASNTEVARLYKFKNSRIKRDLYFITKANKAKMA
ncbi:hypothetical protein [Maribacter ulvicola]|uniref:Uncharacterized protein n=1 Tax=Maribacter ulvicola TaxID=228959 RepID=A0A1N6ZE84_9FLAO|nr:hypothetical protein [Maribacter ulvicola]SIR25103.1 hypothetical protein SAMN05421797_108152 [Maribacter ulvicola]